jgi:hypothetical protein
MKYMGKRRFQVAVVAFLALGSAVYLTAEWWEKWYEPRHTWEAAMKAQTNVPAGNNAVASAGTVVDSHTVIVPIGEARFTNAILSMSNLVAWVNALPKERGSDKPMLMTGAGIIFFSDCLMSKMANGRIKTTTNEMRECLAIALDKLFPNSAPPAELLQGFNQSFDGRPNYSSSMPEHFKWVATFPECDMELKAVDAAFQKARVVDGGSSDLKLLCAGLCEVRTTLWLLLRPDAMDRELDAQTLKSIKTYDDARYQSFSDILDKLLKWRFTHMYSLNDEAAQALVQSLENVRVRNFGPAQMQPPAYIN